MQALPADVCICRSVRAQRPCSHSRRLRAAGSKGGPKQRRRRDEPRPPPSSESSRHEHESSAVCLSAVCLSVCVCVCVVIDTRSLRVSVDRVTPHTHTRTHTLHTHTDTDAHQRGACGGPLPRWCCPCCVQRQPSCRLKKAHMRETNQPLLPVNYCSIYKSGPNPQRQRTLLLPLPAPAWSPLSSM